MDRLVPRPHRLILVMGVASVGKTTIAKLILRRIWCTYLDNNYFADPFSCVSRTDAGYLAVRSKLYEAIYRVALENLSVKNSVLLDIPHVKESRDKSWKNTIQRMSRQTRARLRVIRCVCSEQTLKDRMLKRGEPRDKWKTNNWRQFLKQEPIVFEVPFPFLEIDTECSMTANSDKAIEYIMS